MRRAALPTDDRFWALTEALPSPCVLWRASLDRRGYGKFDLDGRTRLAHRVAYELAVGPIPEGMELDHLCRNSECVNPDHLEPVSRTENLRRSRAAWHPRECCRRGHEYVEGSFTVLKDGSRRCLICRRERNRARKARTTS